VHWTSLLVLVPLLGATLVALMPERSREMVFRVALVHHAAAFAVAVAIGLSYDASVGGLQLAEHLPWDHTPSLGVDGLSAPMLLLTTGLFTAATLTASHVRLRARAWNAWMLLLEAAVLVVFLARSWGLFYAAWEATLVPVFFLVSVWGGEDRRRAAMAMLIYTMGGAVFFLNGLIALYTLSSAHSLPIDGASATAGIDPVVQTVILAAFLVGFGVKLPIVGLHGWLPLAYVEAPTPTTMVLSGVLAKMAAVGLIRVTLLLPAGAANLAPLLLLLGVAGIAHGALLAWRERDLKRVVAWSSLSHMGFVLVGIAAGGPGGLTGASVQMVAHGLVAALLFLSVGVLESHARERDLKAFGGLAKVAPHAAAMMLAGFLASIAVPGTVGFVAEAGLVAAAWDRFGPLALVVPLAALVWASVAARIVLDVVAGPTGSGSRHFGELTGNERVAAVGLVGAIVFLGLVPKLILTPDPPPAPTPSTGAAGEVHRVRG
jgi:NADH-quinone oxidoreductase subunit M